VRFDVERRHDKRRRVAIGDFPAGDHRLGAAHLQLYSTPAYLQQAARQKVNDRNQRIQHPSSKTYKSEMNLNKHFLCVTLAPLDLTGDNYPK
jgi:hypothetical protein